MEITRYGNSTVLTATDDDLDRLLRGLQALSALQNTEAERYENDGMYAEMAQADSDAEAADELAILIRGGDWFNDPECQH